MMKALCPPHSSLGAEIGVQRGDFSAEILAALQPAKLILVDPWQHQDDPLYANDPANIDQGGHEANERFVRERFSLFPHVEIMREFSSFAFLRIPKKSLSWVYLDGAHHFKGVWGDLIDASLAVKDGGVIMGHDYTVSAKALNMGFDVVYAVRRFCEIFGWELFCVTDEEWPSFVLKKP